MDSLPDFFRIEHNNINPEQGRILISEPFSQDSYFKRSVVLLTRYNQEGAVGFILNKPSKLKLHEVLKDFPEFDANVSVGGPVSPDTIHFLHTLGDNVPNTFHVYKNLYWGGDFETLKELIINGKLKPHQIRFFIGYSGWSPGQLDRELNKNFWIVTNTSVENIISNQPDIWKRTLQTLGGKYRIWTNYPEDPAFN